MKPLLLSLMVVVILTGCGSRCKSHQECKDEFEYKLYSTNRISFPFDWQDAEARTDCYAHFGDGSDRC